MNFKLYKKLYESLADFDDDVEVSLAKHGAQKAATNSFTKFIENRILSESDEPLTISEEAVINAIINAGKNHLALDNLDKVKIINRSLLLTILNRTKRFFERRVDGKVINEASYNWIDTSEIDSLLGVFKNNQSFNGDISEWDVSNVKNMTETFFNCANFNRDLSSWNINNVERASLAFIGANPEFQRQMKEKFDNKEKLAKIGKAKKLVSHAPLFNRFI